MDNIDKLVEAVTKEIMKRLGEAENPKILVLGKDAGCPIAACLNESFQADVKPDLQDAPRYDYVVLPVGYLTKVHQGTCWTEKPNTEYIAQSAENTLDFTGKKLVHERELREKCTSGMTCLKVDRKAIITQLATDYIKKCKLNVIRVD